MIYLVEDDANIREFVLYALTGQGYEAQGFASDSGLPGRDSLLVQAGLTLTSSRDFTAQLEVGGEFFRENYTGVNIGLNLAWEF